MTPDVSFDPYDLPDAQLARSADGGNRCLVFVPSQVAVVIGKGSDPAVELRVENIQSDGVPIIRRDTGGCAVVLSPEMVVVSFVHTGRRQRNSSEYFRVFNAFVTRSLANLGISDLEHSGTSDISRHGRKIAGTAIYRNRDLVFYHAVINVSASTAIIERYLKHPPRQPDYRQDRTHAEFVTSLKAEGFTVNIERFREAVEREFTAMDDESGEPPARK